MEVRGRRASRERERGEGESYLPKDTMILCMFILCELLHTPSTIIIGQICMKEEKGRRERGMREEVNLHKRGGDHSNL